MSLSRRIYSMFMNAAAAHAGWDYETSMSILRDKKKIIILGLMLLPALMVTLAFAADLPGTLGARRLTALNSIQTGSS